MARRAPAAQSPTWPDAEHLARVEARARRQAAPRLRRRGAPLPDHLGQVAHGKAFLLQAGDCAESFDEGSADSIRDKLKVILQMAVALTYAVGRAGHQGRPHRRSVRQAALRRRSRSATASRSTPSAVTSSTTRSSTPRRAAPTPDRLLAAYHQSVATLNLLRAFTTGGFAALCARARVEPGVRRQLPRGQALRGARRRDRARARVHARLRHRPARRQRALQGVDFYTSHEALILPYEQALTRRDSLTGDWYDCSAHMLWIGDRTRQLDGAHVEFLRGVVEPASGSRSARAIGADELLRLVERAQPRQRPRTPHADLAHGPRAGQRAARRRSSRPCATRAARSCGPATRCTATRSWPSGGHKTRRFDDVLAEIAAVLRRAPVRSGTWPGGLHVELTGDNVTECLGGGSRARRGRPRPELHLDLRPAAQRAPRASTWPFTSREFLQRYCRRATARGRCSAGVGTRRRRARSRSSSSARCAGAAAPRVATPKAIFIACSMTPPWHDEDDASRRGGARASVVERRARSARRSRSSDSPPGAKGWSGSTVPVRARRSVSIVSSQVSPSASPGCSSHRSQSRDDVEVAGRPRAMQLGGLDRRAAAPRCRAPPRRRARALTRQALARARRPGRGPSSVRPVSAERSRRRCPRALQWASPWRTSTSRVPRRLGAAGAKAPGWFARPLTRARPRTPRAGAACDTR